ncbi:hypothetical protein Pyn_30643 [Prunus yedoensis var. nudiflora]|uniref:LRR receptor-like serine/threonine-protein kinase n=1 Tax=Prunus yedoensis var. nudiflora TaxID=2094558 RepID=A0A314YLQ9_PRUYE|nr:hypothetical protein Pyn_30643 [Prunus yedoensis var. nudiflora]
MNCKHLKVFDAAENQLSGLIPGWLGFELPKLVILILRSNRFYGRIPLQLCNLTHVQILDLSINNISGTIPKCLSNLTALVDKGHSILTITHHYASDFGNGILSGSYDDAATLIWKGIMSEYKSTLGLVKSFHLSSNQFTTTKNEIDDGNPPSCIMFYNQREIDRRLFTHEITTANNRRG